VDLVNINTFCPKKIVKCIIMGIISMSLETVAINNEMLSK
jgi:hypothetical protein